MKRWLPLAWFILLALLVTWPVVLDPFSSVIGHPQASAGCHVWVIWWAQQHLDQIRTDLIFHPYGGDVMQLYGSDVLGPLLLGRLPLSPVLLHNAWVMFLLVLGGWGAFLLSRHRGASTAGALFGGTVFASAPFFQHEILNGTTEILAAAVLPLFALALLRLMERPGVVRGLLAGLVLGLGVSASAYNLFFMAILGCCVMLAWLVRTSQPLLTPALLRGGAAAAAASTCFALPLAWLHRVHGAEALYARREDWTSPELHMPDSFADLSDWVDPRPATIPVDMTYPDGTVFHYWTTCTVYLGLVALALLLLVLWRRRSDGLFLTLLIVSVLIAMGPFLRVGGEPVIVAGYTIGLPSQLLARLFPPFTITAIHTYRYAALVVLAVSVLVSRAFKTWRWVVPATLLLLLDVLFTSPVPWPVATTPAPSSPLLRDLAQLPRGAVFVAPIEKEDLGDLAVLLMGQTIHGKPVQDGAIHRRAGSDATSLFQENPMVAELARVGGPRLVGPTLRRQGLDHLRSLGYRYVLARAEFSQVVAWLREDLGEPMATDQRWVLWGL